MRLSQLEIDAFCLSVPASACALAAPNCSGIPGNSFPLAPPFRPIQQTVPVTKSKPQSP
jgi:hypothetical protein